MSESPDYYHNLSLRLSEVLDDIGVNESIVMARRRMWLLIETLLRITDISSTAFNFGSQSEGTTTLGLNSDIDGLILYHGIQVIQDRSKRQPNKSTLLMVQDETTSPGYCLLQDLSPEFSVVDSKIFITDIKGRAFLKHSISFNDPIDSIIRHGPAISLGQENKFDMVTGFFCSSWPKEAEPWVQQQHVSGWPTEDFKRSASQHGCFVVPVASRGSKHQDTEWRISTAYAERDLMFSLNLTQIRCYILMKMIIKTFFKPQCEDVISSFMCKNVLFHRIANSRACEWKESNLCACLGQCLQDLYKCILTENCPHFIIPQNNLLAGKLSVAVKQTLVEIMCKLTGNIEQSLLGISTDQLGIRLKVKLGRILVSHLQFSEDIAGEIRATMVFTIVGILVRHQHHFIKNTDKNNAVSVYLQLLKELSALSLYSGGSSLQQEACHLHKPLLCARIGSIIASEDLHSFQALSEVALSWFSLGLNSDFSSSRLKLASALYCAGHYEQCEANLAELKTLIELTPVFSKCVCSDFPCTSRVTERNPFFNIKFLGICKNKNVEVVIKQHFALCVQFSSCEFNCLPQELRYEFFRSTKEDLANQDEHDILMAMEWAYVDSLGYMCFLQYKLYSQLHRPVEQQTSLNELVKIINSQNTSFHKETALNLLGQCMEHENRINAALCCYMISMNVRGKNNVAKWHVCRLLGRMFRLREKIRAFFILFNRLLHKRNQSRSRSAHQCSLIKICNVRFLVSNNLMSLKVNSIDLNRRA